MTTDIGPGRPPPAAQGTSSGLTASAPARGDPSATALDRRAFMSGPGTPAHGRRRPSGPAGFGAPAFGPADPGPASPGPASPGPGDLRVLPRSEPVRRR